MKARWKLKKCMHNVYMYVYRMQISWLLNPSTCTCSNTKKLTMASRPPCLKNSTAFGRNPYSTKRHHVIFTRDPGVLYPRVWIEFGLWVTKPVYGSDQCLGCLSDSFESVARCRYLFSTFHPISALIALDQRPSSQRFRDGQAERGEKHEKWFLYNLQDSVQEWMTTSSTGRWFKERGGFLDNIIHGERNLPEQYWPSQGR
jgi:hypothetical protein